MGDHKLAFKIGTKSRFNAHDTEWRTFTITDEDGVNHELELLVSSAMSPEFMAAEGYCRRGQEEADRRHGSGGRDFSVTKDAILSSVKINAQYNEAISTHLVKGWKDVTDVNDAPIDFDTDEGHEGMLKLLEGFPTLRSDIITAATEVAFKVKSRRDETVGKP